MPKRLLNGAELVSFIKERQAKQVRMLRQAHGIVPKLLIIMDEKAGDVIGSYVRMKQRYAEDVLIDIQIISCQQNAMIDHITQANQDATVYGIIVQLPLADPDQTQEIVSCIAPQKDVDGLGSDEVYMSATAEAIDWLVNGYGIDLKQKNIVVQGMGRLVGSPLVKLWRASGLTVNAVTKETTDKQDVLRNADVIVTATGVPHVLKSDQVKRGCIVVDAGTVSEDGVIVGDAEESLYSRDDIIITPKKGGVGPLTVALMFDHVIRAGIARIDEQ